MPLLGLSGTIWPRAAMDNANPTVLNVADLPTRRGKGGLGSKKTAGSEIQQLMQFKSHYMMQDIDLSDPESALESDEETAVEPIDEQEIYGKVYAAILPCSY